jgi:hypothetical protein
MGWGVVQYGTAVPHLTTPTPIPSPQGGGEEFAAAANRKLAAFGFGAAVTPDSLSRAVSPYR